MSDHESSALPCMIVAGPSGVGKGTIIEALKKRHPGAFGFSVSHATRSPRKGEQDGVHYNFVSVDQFESLIKENFFLEYAKVHDNYYGTSFAAIEKVASQGKLCILDIDCQGARSARAAGVKGIYLFISPPSLEELERRLRSRGTETEEAIQRRMETTQHEMAAMNETVGDSGDTKLFDEIICNDVLEDTLTKVEDLLKSHEPVKKLLQTKTTPEQDSNNAQDSQPEEKKTPAPNDAQSNQSDTAVNEETKLLAPTVIQETLTVGWMVRAARNRRRLLALGLLSCFLVASRLKK